MEKRFQDSNEVVKIWRRRHYITLPLWWVWYSVFANFKVNNYNDQKEFTEITYPKWGNLWRILSGLCQMKMGWHYTEEECMKKYKNK